MLDEKKVIEKCIFHNREQEDNHTYFNERENVRSFITKRFEARSRFIKFFVLN